MGIKEGENLRATIESTKRLLEEEVGYRFARANKRDNETIAFSYDLKGLGGAEDRDFQTMLKAYGVDFSDDAQLIELMQELTHIKRYFERTTKDMRGNKDKHAEMLEEVKTELRSKIASSKYLKNLGDEWEKRLDELEVDEDPSIWRYVLKESMEEFTLQLEQELDAVKGVRVMIGSPELMEMYSQLTEMTVTATTMEQDKATVEQCENAIKTLGPVYGELVSINKSLEDPEVTGDDRDSLESRKKILISHIHEIVSADDAKPQKGIERIKSMFSEDGQLQMDDKEFMATFREGLEDLEFETNSRNGKVNEKMLRRDMYDIKRVENMDALDAANKIVNPEARDEQMKKLSTNKEMERYANLLALQRKLDRILAIQKEIQELENQIARFQKALQEGKVPAGEIDKVNSLIGGYTQKISDLKNAMKDLQTQIKKLAQSLNMTAIVGIDVNDPGAVNTALTHTNNTIDDTRKFAQRRKENACARYDVDPTKPYTEIAGTVRTKVEDIKKRKPVRENEVNAPAEVSTVEPSTGAPTGQVPPAAPGGSTSTIPLRYGKDVPVNIPHSSFGTTGYGQPHVSVPAPVAPVPAAPSGTPVEHADNEVNAPVPEEVEEDLDTMVARFEAEGKMPKKCKLLDRIETSDTKLQINTLDQDKRQRIEGGYVYRYTRGFKPNELYFYQEPLEMYLEDPRGDLEDTLDELRERFESELGGSKAVKEYLATHPHNEFLDGLLSGNPMKRNSAKRKFIERLEEANKGDEQMAYVNMTIALMSEIEPEGISATLSRYSQPYNRPTDMSHYVHTVEEKGFLRKVERLEISEDMREWMKKNKPKDTRSAPKKSGINLDKTTDGMIELFTYSPAELGEDEKATRGPQKDPKKAPQKNPPKKESRKQGNPKKDNRRRRDSAPGDRD